MELGLHGFRNVKCDTLDKMTIVELLRVTPELVTEVKTDQEEMGKWLISSKGNILAKVNEHVIFLS